MKMPDVYLNFDYLQLKSVLFIQLFKTNATLHILDFTMAKKMSVYKNHWSNCLYLS